MVNLIRSNCGICENEPAAFSVCLMSIVQIFPHLYKKNNVQFKCVIWIIAFFDAIVKIAVLSAMIQKQTYGRGLQICNVDAVVPVLVLLMNDCMLLVSFKNLRPKINLFYDIIFFPLYRWSWWTTCSQKLWGIRSGNEYMDTYCRWAHNFEIKIIFFSKFHKKSNLICGNCFGCFILDMSYRRRNAGVVCHDGLLFVVGGDDGSANLSNVEVSENNFSFHYKMSNLMRWPNLFFRFTRRRRIHGAF